MKRSVIVAGISGGSSWRNLKRASGAPTVEWVSRLSSNTGILSAYLGKATLIQLRLLNLSLKAVQSYRAFGSAVTKTAVTRSI
jgi:hypothetical protein